MADIQKVVVEAVFRDEMSAGMAAAAGAADKLNTAIDRQETTFRRAGPTAESLVRKLDAVTKAEAQLEAATARAAREQASLQAGLAAQTVSADQVARSMATHNAQIAAAEAALARARAAATSTAAATGTMAKSTGEAAWQMRQLALQAPDVVQGLLGGQSAFQVLLQQGGQVVQVMGGVGAALRGVASIVGSAIASPAGVVAIGTAALAAFGYAAESAERRMIGMQNSLRATRSDYVALAETVNTTAKRLAATTNIGTADAREAGTIIAASPMFSGSNTDLERNIKLARDLAAVMGTDLPQAATKLATAMRDPGAAAQQLADGGFRSMSQALANSIKLQADAGDRAGAYARVIEAMGQTVDGAGEPQTRLQKALAGLTEAFTKAGQSGKSLAEEIGGVITDAASWAIEKVTAFINTLQSLRDLLPQIVPGGGAGGGAAASPSFWPTIPGAGLFGAVREWLSGRSPASQMRPASGGGAVVGGGVQLAPDLSGYSPQVIDLARAIAMKESGGQHTDARGNVKIVDSGDGTGSRVGMFQLGSQFVQDFAPGTDVMTRDGNIAAALKGIDALLQWAGGDTLKAALAFRLGKGGAEAVLSGARVASPAVTAYVNDVSGGDLGARVQSTREGRQLADQAFGASRGVLSQRIAENTAQQRLMERGIAQAAAGGDTDTVGRLTERLRELRGAATDLITEQEKLARSARDSVAPLQAEEGATRDLAAIRQQFVEAARRSGTAVDEGALATAQAAKLQTLSVAYYDNVDALNRKADAEARVLPLLEQGGRAAEYAANREKAVEEARKNTLPGTAARRVAEDALTAALNRGTDAQIDRQAAMDVAGFAKQQEYLETELSLLTATTEKRAEELAILQERQKLGLKLGEQATVEQQKALDAAAAVARVGTELQRQRSGLEALSGGIIQIFDRVGDAITDAFVQGSGAAVRWGNVTKAIGAQVLSMFIRLGAVTPITNALFGRNEGTLWSGLAALGGAGASGGASSGGGIMDYLGLSSLLPKDGIMSALGLDSLFGGQTLTQSLSTGASSVSGGFAGFFGPAALGFGAGSLLNSLLGRKGAQATNGMIGSGLGALAGAGAALIPALSAIPGIGPILGIAGGLLGGGLGGMIGPKESVKGYGYQLVAADDGLLKMGATAYNDSGQAAFQEAAQGIAAFNDWAGRMGIRVGGGVVVGGNKNGADYSHATAGTFSEGLSQLFYSSTDSALDFAMADRKGRKFGSTDELQKFVEGFKNAQAAIETLTAKPVAAFTQQMDALTKTFDDAIAQAREYGLAEDKLTEARAKAVSELEAQRAATIRNTRDNLEIRRLTAGGDSMGAELARQALDARTELADFTKQIDELGLAAADRAALLVDLEQTQAAERADIIRRYGEEAANALRQAGGSIRAYIDSLNTSAAGGLSPGDRLTNAQAQFDRDRTLAMGGDRDALGRITSTADALLGAGRDVYASSAGFQTIRDSVISGLSNLPVVKSYDAMQADALLAIQDALENGTLDTKINPVGNLVTIGAGVLDVSGIEDRLAAMHASMYAIGGVTNELVFGGTRAAYDIAAVTHEIAVGAIGAAHQIGAVTHEFLLAMQKDMYVIGGVTHEFLYAIQGGIHVGNTFLAGLVDIGAAANDNLMAGHQIAVDASAANVISLGAVAAVAADSAVAVVTALGVGHEIAVNAGNAVVTAIGGGYQIAVDASAANIIAQGAGHQIAVDGFAAVVNAINAGHQIAVDAAVALMTSIQSMDINNVAVGNATNVIGASINTTTDLVRARVVDVADAIGAVNDNLMLFNRYNAATAWNTMLSAGAGGLAVTPDPKVPGSGLRYDGSNVIPFARGGLPELVSQPTMAPLALFGEAGPEAIMPLGRTASGDLGVYSIPTGGMSDEQAAAILSALERLESAVRQVGTAQALEAREAGEATVEAVNRVSTTIDRRAALR